MKIIKQNITVSIISVGKSFPKSLKRNWNELNQIITYLHNNELFVAIDNLEGVKSKNNSWIGKKFTVGEKILVNILDNSGFDWIEKLAPAPLDL